MQQFNNQQSDIGIHAAAYCLPGEPIDIVEWAPEQHVDPTLVEQLLANGCRYFHIGCEQSDAELISQAIDQILVETQIDPNNIDFLLHAHSQPFSAPAAPSSILAEITNRYSLDPKLTFSVTHLACASVINAILWASELLTHDANAQYALVVTADRVFGKAKHRIRQDAGIQSDGGSAILLSKHNYKCRLGHVAIRNFPQLHEGPSTPENALAIGRYTWLQTRKLLSAMSENTGIRLEDYEQILPVNADQVYWHYIAKSLGLSHEKFFLDNIGLRGHACCADFAINLVDQGFRLLDAGKQILSCGQSNVGAHAALALLPVSTKPRHTTKSFKKKTPEVIA